MSSAFSSSSPMTEADRMSYVTDECQEKSSLKENDEQKGEVILVNPLQQMNFVLEPEAHYVQDRIQESLNKFSHPAHPFDFVLGYLTAVDYFHLQQLRQGVLRVSYLVDRISSFLGTWTCSWQANYLLYEVTLSQVYQFFVKPTEQRTPDFIFMTWNQRNCYLQLTSDQWKDYVKLGHLQYRKAYLDMSSDHQQSFLTMNHPWERDEFSRMTAHQRDAYLHLNPPEKKDVYMSLPGFDVKTMYLSLDETHRIVFQPISRDVDLLRDLCKMDMTQRVSFLSLTEEDKKMYVELSDLHVKMGYLDMSVVHRTALTSLGMDKKMRIQFCQMNETQRVSLLSLTEEEKKIYFKLSDFDARKGYLDMSVAHRTALTSLGMDMEMQRQFCCMTETRRVSLSSLEEEEKKIYSELSDSDARRGYLDMSVAHRTALTILCMDKEMQINFCRMNETQRTSFLSLTEEKKKIYFELSNVYAKMRYLDMNATQ